MIAPVGGTLRVTRRLLGVVVLMMMTASFPSGAAEPGVDELFAQARELGFAGQREQARDICDRILARSPGYHDVRVFLGRLYTWDKMYDPAREALEQVLNDRPDYLDAQFALIDVEQRSRRWNQALRHCEQGLEIHPDQPELLYRKAKVLEDLNRKREAIPPAEAALKAKPGWEEAERLVERLRLWYPRQKLGTDFRYEDFDDGTEPWKDLSLEYNRRLDWGPLIFRINLADRFDRTDEQFEVDAYPRIGGGMYLYLNAGYAPSATLFPERRYGGELFSGLPHSLEASIGFRRLEFESSNVTLLTGSFGKYHGNYFSWIRLYHSDKDFGTSTSGSLSVRRYYGDRETYWTVEFGTGSSPDEIATTTDVIRLDSRKISFDAQKRIRKVWILKGDVGYRDEELPAGSGKRDRESWVFGVGVERFFN